MQQLLYQTTVMQQLLYQTTVMQQQLYLSSMDQIDESDNTLFCIHSDVIVYNPT
jgi:hypothetical protein